MATPQLTPGMVFARDYRVIRPLAEGGMGAVYVAEQLSTGNLRALKLMHPQLVADPRHRERFLLEARLGAQIRSAHVVEVTAAGIDEATATPWLAMELLEGSDLARVIAERGALDARTVHGLCEQLGDALGRAHALGIVHRDLKPENLFVASSRFKGVPFVVKVLDFGVARIVAEHKTAATVTTAIGSPLWMAPEQAHRGARVRPATDVWALGLIVFTLLTGRPYWLNANGPDEGFNLQALLVELMVEPIVPPSVRATQLGVRSALPAGFDGWFARCVHRDPEQRFADGAQAVGALLPLLASPSPETLASTLALSAPPPVPDWVSPSRPAPSQPLPATAVMQTMVVPEMTTAPPTRRNAAILAGATLVGVVAIVGAWMLPRSAPRAAPAVEAQSPAAVPATPHAAPVAPEPPDDVPTPEPSASRAEVSPPTDARPAMGEIEVRTNQPCDLSLDGTPMGTAPRRLAVRTGTYTLHCSRHAETRTARVSVVAHQRAQVGFAFASASAGSVDDLLNRALRPSPPPAPPTTALPETPGRDEVLQSLRAISPRVRACGRGQGGTVQVTIVFEGSGAVAEARVGSPMDASTAACVVAAARRARVSPFTRPSFSVTYPYVLD